MGTACLPLLVLYPVWVQVPITSVLLAHPPHPLLVSAQGATPPWGEGSALDVLCSHSLTSSFLGTRCLSQSGPHCSTRLAGQELPGICTPAPAAAHGHARLPVGCTNLKSSDCAALALPVTITSASQVLLCCFPEALHRRPKNTSPLSCRDHKPLRTPRLRVKRQNRHEK